MLEKKICMTILLNILKNLTYTKVSCKKKDLHFNFQKKKEKKPKKLPFNVGRELLVGVGMLYRRIGLRPMLHKF